MLALAFFLLCLTGFFWAFVFEPSRVTVNEVTIPLPGWPEPLEGLRVILLADLHVGSPHNGLDKLQEVVSTTNTLQPDLILLGGDFLIDGVLGGSYVQPAPIAEELTLLRARLGVFAVLGNHDWWNEGPEVIRLLENAGIEVLENDVAHLQEDGQTLWVAGLSDLWTTTPDIESTLRKVTDDGPVLALTHHPDLFPKIPSRVALTFAGHTHGGQGNLPFLGRKVVPSQYGGRYAIGHIIEDGRHLFVTPGIGTSILPVRFRVPPEISVLTLVREN